jgi:hypothetical protein
MSFKEDGALLFLCTRASLYAPCSLLLISNKGGGGPRVAGWGGGGVRGGRCRAIKLLYAPAPPPSTVWALKPPSWALHLLVTRMVFSYSLRDLTAANFSSFKYLYIYFHSSGLWLTYVYSKGAILVCTQKVLCWYAHVGLSRVGSCT